MNSSSGNANTGFFDGGSWSASATARTAAFAIILDGSGGNGDLEFNVNPQRRPSW